MKKIKVNFKKTIVWFMVFAVTYWSIGLNFNIPFASASLSIKVGVEGLANDNETNMWKISATSSPYAILRMDVFTDQPGAILASTTVHFSGNGFATSTLKDLMDNPDSGAAFYKDDGNGYFEGSDVFLNSTIPPFWVGDNAVFSNFLNNNSLTQDATSTFFIAIRTSITATNDTEILASIQPDNIKTTIGTGPGLNEVSNAFYVDTVGPSINYVGIINPTTVVVNYDDFMDDFTAASSSNYSFSEGQNILNIFQESPHDIRIETDMDIEQGTTTLTVTSNVKDIAGNSNTTTGSNAIIKPIKVKISEISADMGDPDAEFIELYNASAGEADINGWTLEYSVGNDGSSWSTLATTSGVAIPAFSYYLLSTALFDIGSPVDGDQNFSAGLDLAGGHVRLMNGATEKDKVGWGNAVAAEGNPIQAHPTGQSIERKAFGDSTAIYMAEGGVDQFMGNSWDTNNNSFDLVIQASSSPQNTSSPAEQMDYVDGGGGPMIDHMPVNFADTNNDLEIIARMGDPSTPIDNISAKLLYMVGDNNPNDNVIGDYTSVIGVHQSNGFFKFIIPQAAVSAAGSTDGLYYILKLVAESESMYMSASPDADMANDEAWVAREPFIVDCASAGTLYNISGSIVDDTSSPMSGVFVFLAGAGYSTTTDSNGNYLIHAPSGLYELVMTKDGYFEEWMNDVFVNGTNQTIPTKTMLEGTGGGMTGDSSKPFITWTGPPDGMIGIPPLKPDFEMYLGFSKDMDYETINSNNIYFTTDGVATITPAQVFYDNQPDDNESIGRPDDYFLGVVYPPSGGFDTDKTYYLVVSGKIRDTSGNALQGNTPEGDFVTSFSTGADMTSVTDWSGYGSGEMMPPWVEGVSPRDGTMGVATNTKIIVKFSDSMDESSVETTGNIKLKKLSLSGTTEIETPVVITTRVDNTGRIAVITPSNGLSGGKYRVIVTGALKSAAGMWMGDPGQNQNVDTYRFYDSKFEVNGTKGDYITPTIIGSWPSNGDTGINVNPGPFNFQFSESLDPTTVNTDTVTLRRGTSLTSTVVSTDVYFDPMSRSISLAPKVVLATNVDYTIRLTSSIADMAGNAMASDKVIVFTTSNTGDNIDPEIMYANGDEFGIAITFTEAMKAAKVTETGWSQSIINPNNYNLKWGDPGTVQGAGTVIDLASVNAKLYYDSQNNTVMIENLGLDPSLVVNQGKDFFIDMSSSGATDLSENLLASSSMDTFQMPINNSVDTMGMLGPSSGGDMTVNMEDMGMMMAGASPMNSMAGQQTVYFVDIPTTKSIPIGGKIVLTFPAGFDVSGAKKEPYSLVNNDINEWNEGVVEFSTAVEISGGENNDGVTVNVVNRTVTVTIANSATQQNDYLHFDLAGIINSLIPRDFDTSGYSVDIKTMDTNGNLLETVNTMPFFIVESGTAVAQVVINGVTNGHNGDFYIYLGSPMTGPIEKKITFNNQTTATTTFTNLPDGEYNLFTDPNIDLSGNDYSGLTMPEPFRINSLATSTKIVALRHESSGAGKASITVNITGSFGNDDIDIFASSPSGSKVKTIEDAGVNPSATFYLPDGNWKVGMGPAIPKGSISGAPQMPDWMPPMPTEVIISNNGSNIIENSATANDGTVDFVVNSANKKIIGYVTDGSGNAISNAEVWAYQPGGEGGFGANAKTDTSGKFILKVAVNGNYMIGAFKPGLPNVPDRSIRVESDGVIEGVGSNPSDDGNSTADIVLENRLIIDVNGNGIQDSGDNLFKIKITKPAYTISGKVTNGTNAVSYAPVWADQISGGYGHVDTMTDSNGNYILYVNTGTWVVNSYVPGYGDAEAQTVVISDNNEIQNLALDATVTRYNISGKVGLASSTDYTTLETPFSFLPIRAVKYDANGNYLGNEYGSMTDSNGEYTINVPAGIYRVDIWTPDYGELGINNLDVDNNLNEVNDDDDYPNTPANVNVSNDVTNADIIIESGGGNMKTISVGVINSTSTQEGFLNIEGITNSNEPNGFNRHIKINDLSATTTLELATGRYLFSLFVPELGEYMPTLTSRNANGGNGENIVVSNDRDVYFSIPDLSDSSQIITVRGAVTDGSSPISDAWVWVGNPTNGYQSGTPTLNDGTYTLTIPKGNGYKMGADKPGYISNEPVDIDASAAIADNNFTLNANSSIISGYIYKDTNSNSSYDSGEEVPNGFVRAELDDGSIQSHAPVDGNGYFEIGVVNGSWKIYGMANGYQESYYGSTITVSGSDVAGKNIKLAVNSSWTNKSKKKPITPASGGIMDDTNPTGTGVKLTVPPNALGNSTSQGNINANVTSAVTKTNSSDPVGDKGIKITASDNSGQAITNLNDYVDVEMVMYKADVDSGIADESLTYDKLKNTKNGYWDTTTNDWVNLATTRKAYYKNVGDTEWTLYTNSTATNTFEAFINTIEGASYTDYKLVYTSKTNHFTVFAIIMPFIAVTTPNPVPDSPDPIDPGGGGGNTIVPIVDDEVEEELDTEICADGNVVYGAWTDCVNKTQTREIISRSPIDCELTSSQIGLKKRSCTVTEVVEEEKELLNEEITFDAPIEEERIKVGEDDLYLEQGEFVERADITEILDMMKQERNHPLEWDSRRLLIEKMGIDVDRLAPRRQYALTNFIAYGSPDTRKLGPGERAGVVNSFRAAFGGLPVTAADWQDVVKIANGRWPGYRSATAEENAKKIFSKIYLREADMSNSHDNAAVVVISYGLRPANRNVESEKAAIIIFKSIFKINPSSAQHWDVVRSIAYSGATR